MHPCASSHPLTVPELLSCLVLCRSEVLVLLQGEVSVSRVGKPKVPSGKALLWPILRHAHSSEYDTLVLPLRSESPPISTTHSVRLSSTPTQDFLTNICIQNQVSSPNPSCSRVSMGQLDEALPLGMEIGGSGPDPGSLTYSALVVEDKLISQIFLESLCGFYGFCVCFPPILGSSFFSKGPSGMVILLWNSTE